MGTLESRGHRSTDDVQLPRVWRYILPFIGTPPTFIESKSPNEGGRSTPASPHHHHGHHDGGRRFRQKLANSPFVERLHYALTALGPWEGRAVAFVLGCGIGVLLRMLWVLSIVSYRMVFGKKDDEPRYTEIIVVEEYEDADEAAPAPPTYTFADDKHDAKPKVANETD